MNWDLLMFPGEIISKLLWSKDVFWNVAMTICIKIFMNWHWFLNDSMGS